MESVIIIKVVEDPDFNNLANNILVKNIASGQLYIGDGSNVMNEIKTDKSNNWAKTFFYGGD
jgi:uncharacterized membrane protein YjjP (DUF1212 family)